MDIDNGAVDGDAGVDVAMSRDWPSDREGSAGEDEFRSRARYRSPSSFAKLGGERGPTNRVPSRSADATWIRSRSRRPPDGLADRRAPLIAVIEGPFVVEPCHQLWVQAARDVPGVDEGHHAPRRNRARAESRDELAGGSCARR